MSIMQPRRVNGLQIMTVIAYNLRFTYFLMQLWINLFILMSMLNQNRVLYYDTWLRSVQSKKFRSIHWVIWCFSRRFMILFLPFLILFQSLIYSFSRILCKKRFMKIQRKLALIKFHIKWKYVDKMRLTDFIRRSTVISIRVCLILLVYTILNLILKSTVFANLVFISTIIFHFIRFPIKMLRI